MKHQKKGDGCACCDAWAELVAGWQERISGIGPAVEIPWAWKEVQALKFEMLDAISPPETPKPKVKCLDPELHEIRPCDCTTPAPPQQER